MQNAEQQRIGQRTIVDDIADAFRAVDSIRYDSIVYTGHQAADHIKAGTTMGRHFLHAAIRDMNSPCQ